MKRIFGVLLIAAFLSVMGAARQSPDTTAILDKAITALGGAEKLEKIKSATWKTKGTFTFQGTDIATTTATTVQGLDYHRREFEGEFDGNKVKGMAVLAGDKGWRIFNGEKMPIDDLANEKRTNYLDLIPVTLVSLKKADFKLEALPEEKIADKPVTVLKVTPPDKKEFKLYFDKESGLPVRLVARVTFLGEEFTQQTDFSEYKEMAGIKKATKISAKRDGEKYIESQVTEFTVSEKEADAKTFVEP